MSTKNETFFLLTESEGYISGEQIAKKLSVSRTAVWKAVKALRDEGTEILSSTNKGYKLSLSADKIYPIIIQRRTGIKTEYFESLPSTNSYAKSIKEGFPVAIIAGRQTEGRARFDKRFDSARDGIYMSLCLKEKIGTEYIRTVTEYTVEKVKEIFGGEIKENTLIKNGQKKCGVLTEVECDQDMTEKIIIGVGIYTSPQEDKTSAVIKIISAISKKVRSLALKSAK